jgi:GNAT superfamily N-acetyltransferase
MGASLRDAQPGDAAFLRTLYGSFRAAELVLVPWSAAEKAAFVDDQFHLQHLHFTRVGSATDFWILMQGPGAVGRLYLERSAPCWRIVDIGLVPEARGRGLGSALLDWISEAAVTAGAEGVALQVAASNRRARALYLRQGFRDDGAPEAAHQPMRWRPSLS